MCGYANHQRFTNCTDVLPHSKCIFPMSERLCMSSNAIFALSDLHHSFFLVSTGNADFDTMVMTHG